MVTLFSFSKEYDSPPKAALNSHSLWPSVWVSWAPNSSILLINVPTNMNISFKRKMLLFLLVQQIPTSSFSKPRQTVTRNRLLKDHVWVLWAPNSSILLINVPSKISFNRKDNILLAKSTLSCNFLLAQQIPTLLKRKSIHYIQRR